MYYESDTVKSADHGITRLHPKYVVCYEFVFDFFGTSWEIYSILITSVKVDICIFVNK